ncbi:hypothetical protein [Methylobacterium sp. JK268]
MPAVAAWNDASSALTGDEGAAALLERVPARARSSARSASLNAR